MNLRKIKILLLAVLLLPFNTFAQQRTVIGVPYIINYFGSPFYEYEGAFMDITTDSSGYIYAASELGLLYYDGTKWETLVEGKFNSVAYDTETERLFAGYAGGFGFVSFDSLTGKPFFKKISDQVAYPFKTVYYTLATRDGLYFFANRKDLFYYDRHTIKKLTSKKQVVYRGFVENGTLYIVGKGFVGKVKKDQIEILNNKNAAKTLENLDIRALFEQEDSILSLITKNGNVYWLNTSDGEVKKINKQQNPKLANYQVYRGVKIGPNAYLLATLSGGLVAIDHQAHIIDILNDKYGLGSNAIYDLTINKDGTLWLASAKGAIEVYTNVPFRYNGNKNGIKGIITDYAFFDKYIIVTTQEGFYYTSLSEKNFERNFFKKIQGSSITYKNSILLELSQKGEKILLISAHRKLQYLDTNLTLHTISDFTPSIVLKSSTKPESEFFIISDDSLYLCTYKIRQNKFTFEKKEQYFSPKNFSIGITSSKNNLFLLDVDNNQLFMFDNSKKIFYKISDDTLAITNIQEVNGQVYAFTRAKTFIIKLDENNIPSLIPVDNQVVSTITALDDLSFDGKYWWLLKDKNLIVYNSENDQKINVIYCDTKIKQPRKILIDSNYISFITSRCFINFRPEELLRLAQNYQAKKPYIKLRYIIVNDKKIYTFPNLTLQKTGEGKWILNGEIPWKHKLIIKVANPNDILNISGYQYKITNYDKQWSELLNGNELTLMNLPAGKHKILIRGFNQSGVASNTIEIEIKVAPPFYQSIYAITIYFGLLLLFIFTLSHRANKAEREKKRLERIVKRRTKEIIEKNKKLEELSEELKQQKEELETQNEKLKLTNLELRQLSLVVQKTDNSVIILDQNGNIEWWNEGFYKLFKYKFDKFKNFTLRQKKEKLRPDLPKAIEKVKQTKESITYTSHEVFDDLQEIWYQTNITPILDEQGEIFRYVVIDIDITEMKIAEKKIKKQASRLELQTEILKKNNNLLREQKKELQIKTKEILSSLEYAKKIQKALFSEREISQIFKEYFIFFKAKEIVSGDFFYVTRKENKILLAVADSTGHGVPGAFMSVLGSTLLKDTIEKISELKPNLILQRLRNMIIMTLHQENKIGNIKDGMDIGLVVLEPDKKRLLFSGANIPLLITRPDKDGKYQMQEIKPNRIPIGLHDLMNKPFTLHEIELTENDRLYMNTDGFTDQFGGPNNKRYKRSRFRKFILSIQHLSLKEQKEAIKHEFEKWKGKHEQIDDILIVGVSVKNFFQKNKYN